MLSFCTSDAKHGVDWIHRVDDAGSWGTMLWTPAHLYSRRLGTDKQAVPSRESQGFAIHGNSRCALLKGKKAFNFPCPVPSRKKMLHVRKSILLKEHLKPVLFHKV